MENPKLIIDELYFCSAQCIRCYNACQVEKEKGHDTFDRCMMLVKDCDDICRLTAQLMERNSENGEILLRMCGEICEKTAVECEQHSGMEPCEKCADICRTCADMCLQYQTV